MPSPDSRVLTAHVPAPLAAKVDVLAERLDRSRGWVVKQALAAWVELEEERHQLTLDGLADSKSVDHAEVESWAESLMTPNPLPVPKCI
jgi:predicted transcriptional regulator